MAFEAVVRIFTEDDAERFANQERVTETAKTVSRTAFRSALALRPPDSDIERFRRIGAWRAETPLDDLVRWREETPDSLAVVSYRVDAGAGSRVERLTYREYAEYVDRFAVALYQLGVRPGEVVALQLPNRWQLNALVLACVRIGAVVAPIMTTIRPRELERVLRWIGASVCVTIDR
ncbi:AMP-binding protein [Pseudonocardia alaniniphila]|uniref:AMP-binding protein n=1 Tax=Pseudonocardia alaniniphila TaxID=75291 RepID=A0ABS9TV27_9PSEU|nr:AMP-binding protein [Pseudonocardia alaniniphila]MCH6172346.1 AMP-binding protein [Pseudonocardia alaniniphila]